MQFTDIHLDQLQSFFNQNEIPIIKKKPKTFLGIAKQPHYENVLSNIYAFYFNVNEVHNLKTLFIDSLMEIIIDSEVGAIKTGLKDFQDFAITTELGTTGGGRIDLLLRNDNQAIIIENKIYHHLINDLEDYWSSTKVPAKNKIGIVLSLLPMSKTEHNNFINITHLELIKKIQNRLGNFILDANQKYLVFLQDFFQNITNMSTKQLGEKKIDFYFTNLSKIKSIKALDNAVFNHIVHQIELAGQHLEGLSLVSPRANSGLDKRVRYYSSTENTNLVIAVIFDDVIDKQQITVKVQLRNELLKDRARFWNVHLSDDESKMKNHKFEKDENTRWSDFVIKQYSLNQVQITNLSDFIYNQLEADKLISIFKKVEALVPKKKRKIK